MDRRDFIKGALTVPLAAALPAIADAAAAEAAPTAVTLSVNDLGPVELAVREVPDLQGGGFFLLRRDGPCYRLVEEVRLDGPCWRAIETPNPVSPTA